MNDQEVEQAIQAKGKTAPRITPADIQAAISGEFTFTVGNAARALNCPVSDAADLLTICVLTLRNGFTVTGESACASPENFDAEIGQKIALDNAKQKLWPLLGYELKQRLFEESRELRDLTGVELLGHFNDIHRQYLAAGAEVQNRGGAGMSGRPLYQQRVIDENADLTEKAQRLAAFTIMPTFQNLPGEERARLGAQLVAMNTYSQILAERIAAFPAQEGD